MPYSEQSKVRSAPKSRIGFSMITSTDETPEHLEIVPSEIVTL